MAKIQARLLINTIWRVFRFRVGEKHKRGLLIVMLFPFMSAQSFRDAAETCGVSEELLYAAIDEFQDVPALNALRREGLSRLISHLEMLEKADSSVRSRKCITFCGDDFTRKVRGDMGGLAHPCYSGADKGVVYGLKTEALIAVIGENEQYFILDVRLIPPKKVEHLFKRATHIEWMEAAIKRVVSKVQSFKLTVEGCYLSVDSGFASGAFVKEMKDIGLEVVTELKSSYIVWSKFWIPVPLGIYFNLFEIGHREKFKPITGDPKVQYLRHRVDTLVYGDTPLALLQIGDEIKKLYFSNPNMKTITIRRVAKRRWQLERVFWNLKQLLGFPMIHHQIRRRVLVRIYLTFHLAQAIKDCTSSQKITANELHKIFRRDPRAICAEIMSMGASVRSKSGKLASGNNVEDISET